jgi:hypothetical protein
VTSVRRLVLLVILCPLLLASCSGSGEGSGKSSVCRSTQDVVADAQREAEIAIAQIADDPTSTLSALADVHAALSRAQTNLSDEELAAVTRALTATDELSEQAQRGKRGRPVRGTKITHAREELLGAVEDTRVAC